MAKNEYIARRPFAELKGGDRLVQAGEVITINSKSVAKDMQKKGLVYPNYKTKEDKEAMKVEKPTGKVRIEHDAGGMYFVLRGDEVLDRKRKSEAEKLRDKLNE